MPFFVGSGASHVISSSRGGLIWPMGRVSLQIFLKVSLLDKFLNLFLELITILSVVSLALSSWFRTHYNRLRSGKCRDVVQVKNLAPNLLTTGVQRREILHRLSYFIECTIVFYGRCITTLPLMVGTLSVRNTLLDITCLLFGIALLTLYGPNKFYRAPLY